MGAITETNQKEMKIALIVPQKLPTNVKNSIGLIILAVIILITLANGIKVIHTKCTLFSLIGKSFKGDSQQPGR